MADARSFTRVPDLPGPLYRERGDLLFDVLDLLHNAAVWMVLPEARPHRAPNALEAVACSATSPRARAWLVDALRRRNRHDVIARLEQYHGVAEPLAETSAVSDPQGS